VHGSLAGIANYAQVVGELKTEVNNSTLHPEEEAHLAAMASGGPPTANTQPKATF